MFCSIDPALLEGKHGPCSKYDIKVPEG